MFQDGHRGDFFAAGERQGTYRLAPVGGEPIPVTMWIDDFFLIDDKRGHTANDLMDKITAAIGTHFMMDETDRRAIVQAELVRQYRLRGVNGNGEEVDFEVDVFRDRASSTWFATTCRKAIYEMLPAFRTGMSGPFRIRTLDDTFGDLPLEAAPGTDLLRPVIQRISEHYSLSVENVMVFSREYQCLLDGAHDPESLGMRITIDRRCADGRLIASAETLDGFEAYPVDHPEQATIETWIDDPLISSAIAHVAADSVDELCRVAVNEIVDRYLPRATPNP